MKITVDEKTQNSQNRNTGSNKNLNVNNTLVSKDIDKATADMRLSDSNLEYNSDESKNKDLRCLSCYLIPFLTLNPPAHTVNVNCNFGHSTTVDIEEYLQHGFDNNFSNLSCSKCKTEILKNKKNFVYCKECSELLCKNCVKKHDELYEENHHMVHLDKFDTTCILHNETYDYFCSDCKKNICQYCCDEFHNEHKLIDLDDINLKRKEIKKIKEHFVKEKENYLNIPKVLNELVSKLKEDIDKIINNISNEIKFKESIINTYENKLDNYNVIINFKNLKFNIEPFTINKDMTNLENIIELIKYLNLSVPKTEEKKDNLQKSTEKVKLKKRKLVNKNSSSKKVNKNSNQTKVTANEANNNNADNENNINKENNANNENENNKEVVNNNSSKSNEKVYKKNFIQKKINSNNGNNNNNNNNNNSNNNNVNVENSKKNLSKITEDESSNNQNNANNIQETSNKKEEVSIPPSKEEKIENKENQNIKQKNNTITNINNKIESISKNINNKVTSNSTNNINYVRPESNVKLPVRSNKSIHFDKNVEFKNRKESHEMLSQHSKSQKSFTSISNDPMGLIKQLNDHKLPLENISKQQKIINNNRMVENKSRERKMMVEEMKRMNMKQNNKKLKEEYDDDDEDLDEEEEEEEDDEDEEDEEEEDSESEESEEDDKIVKKNRFNKNQNSDRILVKEDENDFGNLNINKEMAMEENDTSFRHKKIYPRPSMSTENVDLSELFTRKKNLQNMKNNLNDKNEIETKTKIRIVRDMTVNEFRPNSSTLKIKESDNMVCCMLEVRDNIFACGFLLGQIDVYDINYLNCLFTIYEHKSRVSNMVLLKDKCILTSSFDSTMKKIRITNSNSYIVDFTFSVFKHPIYKGIELTNNNILAISFKGNIDIFRRTDKNNKYSNFISHEIAEEEIYNVIELYQNNEIAFATDECLRFFSIDSFQNIGNIHLLEFAKGNNMLYMGKNNLIVMLRHHIGLVNIPQRQCIFKCSFGEAGKPECLCYLKDNTILMGVSNNIKENKTIEFIFKQYGLKMNKLKLIAEKMEVIDKIKKDDYFRITSILELKNKVIAYGTAGFEEFKLVGNISIID